MNDLSTLDREAEQIVKEIGIPPCPAVLTKLLREMRDDEPDLERIGGWIGSDVSLAGAMLKTVNSAFYGLSTKATSVQEALALLGLGTVARLITGLLLREAFPLSAHPMMESFWEKSSNVANICAYLAPQLSGLATDEAYTFGLFRDCGIPIMIFKFTNYSRFYRKTQSTFGLPMTEVEDELYKMDHARVGYQLAKSWHLDDDTCQSILAHHNDKILQLKNNSATLKNRQFVALGILAEQLFKEQISETECPEWTEGKLLVLSTLNISDTEYRDWSTKIDKILRLT